MPSFSPGRVGSAPTGPSLGVFGNFRTIPDRYMFGSPAEIAERVATNYPSAVEAHPTTFQQIRPGPSSVDMNSHTPRSYSGNQKFTSGVRRYA